MIQASNILIEDPESEVKDLVTKWYLILTALTACRVHRFLDKGVVRRVL